MYSATTDEVDLLLAGTRVKKIGYTDKDVVCMTISLIRIHVRGYSGLESSELEERIRDAGTSFSETGSGPFVPKNPCLSQSCTPTPFTHNGNSWRLLEEWKC